MGITHKIGTSPNQEWKLGDNLGTKFESLVFQVISKELSPYFEMGTRICQTPRSNDGGKDIIVTSPVDISSMLGQSFNSKIGTPLKIYIECKSTDQDSLGYDKIIVNISKIKDEKIDYVVLVTNSYILPCTYHKVYEELKLNNVEFILVDQYLLAKYLVKMDVSWTSQIPLCKDEIQFYGNYQVVSGKENGRNIYDIF